MQKNTLFITVGLIAAISLATGLAYAKATSAQGFVEKASVANMFEIESSKLALQKAQRKEVKSFARTMVEDHTKTGEKLKGTLSSSDSNAKPASELDSKHKQLLDKLSNTPTENFDKEYVNIQTDAHKEAVALFSNYSKFGQDAALKDFAGDTLPALEGHLQHVQKLKVGG